MLAALTALAAFTAWAPCSHTPASPAPVASAESRAEARVEIRKVVEQLGGSPELAAYLIHVGHRESELLPGLIHVGDDALAAAAYKRLRAHHQRAHHRFANRPVVWRSFGLFGMNSNYYGEAVSDPRQLCTVEGAIGAYMVKGRSVLRRMRRCQRTAPTWGDLHRAIQGGDLCPNGRPQTIPMADLVIRTGDLGHGPRS